jgi:hypothetical protein
MRRITLCLIIVAWLSGCSNTTIHLHPESLTQERTEEIVRALKREGLAVKIRNNRAPTSGNTLIYSPHEGIDAHLASIRKILSSHDMTLDQAFLRQYGGHDGSSAGQHVYTEGNIGLYLASNADSEQSRGAKVRSVFPISIIGFEFASRDCDALYLYEFFESGDAVVTEISEADKELGEFSWSQSDAGIVTLSSGDTEYQYRKRETHSIHQEFGHNIVTYVTELQPDGFYPMPYGCTYEATYTEAFEL